MPSERSHQNEEGSSSRQSVGDVQSPCTIREKIEGLFDLLRSPDLADAAPTSAACLHPGSRLSEFEIIRHLGSGGMGSVYLAKQTSLDRLVALKVCAATASIDRRTAGRFEQEGNALAKLQHPNIVPVIAQGEAEGTLYLAMEYVPGPTLADLLAAIASSHNARRASDVVDAFLDAKVGEQRRDSIDGRGARLDRRYFAWITELLRRVADGLAAVHGIGIIHRDVKPSNVVLDRIGVPKIVDFGLARIGADSTVTQAGDLLGTPAYASPEQLRGEQSAMTPASDVFSFGVMMYECLSLKRPFDGLNTAEVIKSVLADTPPLLRSKVRSAPWELEAIVDRCLNKVPADRYESSRPLADDLTSFLELRAIQARKATASRKLMRAAMRRPWLTVSLVSALLAISSGGVAVRQSQRIAAEAAATERQRLLVESIDAGDQAAFRLLAAERPTWMHPYLEQVRRKGIEAYGRAISFNPDAPYAYVQRGRLRAVEDGGVSAALEDFRRAKQLRPGWTSPSAYLQYYEAGVDTLPPKDVTPSSVGQVSDDLYLTGAFLAQICHDKEGARDAFEKCLLLEPRHYWARVERADYAATSDINPNLVVDKRIQELTIAKGLRPDLPFAGEALVDYLQAAGKDRAAEDELRDLIEKFGLNVLRAHRLAEFYETRREYVEARDLLLQAKEMDPYGGTGDKLGDLHMRAGQLPDAIHWFEVAKSEARTPSPHMLCQLADAYDVTKRPELAETNYREAVDIVKQASQWKSLVTYVHVRYARWLESQGRLVDAQQTFDELLDLKVPGGEPFLQYAALHQRQFAHEKAIEVLQRGLKSLSARESRSDADQLEQSLRRADRHALQGALIEAYLAAERYQEAVSEVEQLQQDFPYTLQQTQILIDFMERLNLHEEALLVARTGEFSEAVQRDPLPITSVDVQLSRNNATRERMRRQRVRYSLGVTLLPRHYLELARDDQAEAVDILQVAARRFPESFQIHARLAATLQANGRLDEANAELTAALDAYATEIRQLVTWKDLPPIARPVDYLIRLEEAREPRDFLVDCYLAASQELSQTVTEQLQRSLDELDADIALIHEAQEQANTVATDPQNAESPGGRDP
ncbi:MAG: hypothetical protein CMJ58_00335 [Planctomycetaceae bacterium]|nr:hypothetical protein [Planctomycetaceae bacterium]